MEDRFRKARLSMSLHKQALTETTRFYLFTIEVSDGRPIQVAYARSKDGLIRSTNAELADQPHLTAIVTARPHGFEQGETHCPGYIDVAPDGQLVQFGDVS